VTSLDLIEEVVNRDERFLVQGEEVLAKIRETAHQMTGRVARALRTYRAADRGVGVAWRKKEAHGVGDRGLRRTPQTGGGMTVLLSTGRGGLLDRKSDRLRSARTSLA
jgi:hypothetical protein